MPNVEPPALQEHMSMDLVASPYERQLHVPAPIEWGHTLRSVQGTTHKRPHSVDNAEQI